jgi:outer membrane lipoprotein-sorting protein
MMKYFALIFAFIFFQGKVHSDPDPKATKWLKKVEKVYNSFSSLKIDLSIESKPAEQKAHIQTGTFIYQDKAFSLVLPDQEVYFDGHTQYTYFKERKEVQITSSTDENAVYHPKFFARLYKSGKYDYRLDSEDAKTLTIEFIPVDKKESFFKIKIRVRKADTQMIQIQIYERNGDKIIINNKKIIANTPIQAKNFSMDPLRLKGLHVEDLRDE